MTSWPIRLILLLNPFPDTLCPFSIIGLQNHSLSDFFHLIYGHPNSNCFRSACRPVSQLILIVCVHVILFRNLVVFPRVTYLRPIISLFQVSHIYAMGNPSACLSILSLKKRDSIIIFSDKVILAGGHGP